MFHGLKLYTVHTKPGSDVTLDKPVFLREGFNWLAFLFVFLWGLYHRLWLFSAVAFLGYVLVAMAIHYGHVNELQAGIVQFGIQLIAGFCGNDALRAKMHRRGYIFQDITSGDSLLRAEQRYFDRFVAHA